MNRLCILLWLIAISATTHAAFGQDRIGTLQESDHAADVANSDSVSNAVEHRESVDTTSTRTYGTAPGTGPTGAGSGNGDATGTGTPGSAGVDATQGDRNDKQNKPKKTSSQ